MMHVCMHICVHMSMCVFIAYHIYMFMYTCACMLHMCAHICIWTYMNAHMYVHIYKCPCLCVYLYSACTGMWKCKIWHQVSSSVVLHLSIGDRVFHGTWCSLFCLEWLDGEPWINLSTLSPSSRFKCVTTPSWGIWTCPFISSAFKYYSIDS